MTWTDRYAIVSVRGRYWTRAMVKAAVLRYGRRLFLPVKPADVDRALDDDDFMRRKVAGYIPARAVEIVHEYARHFPLRPAAECLR